MKKKNPKSRQEETQPVLWPVSASLFAIYVLIAVASFLPRVQLWGINHLAFYSLPVRILVLLVMGAAFAPPVARRVYASLLGLSRAIKSGGAKVDITLTVIAALSFLLFVGLRSSTNLLGDGQLIAQSFEAAHEGNQDVVMRSVHAIVNEEPINPGATLFYYGAAKIATEVFEKSPVYGLRYFNCFLGAVFLFILLRLLRCGPFSPEIRLWLMILVLFSSSMELFFGYVENYTPLVFMAFLYVLTCLLILHQRGWLWVAFVLFVLSLYTHVQAFLFAPSLVFVILWRLLKRRRGWVEKFVTPSLIILTVAGAIAAGIFTPLSKFYLPLRADEVSYGLVSPTHLVDIFNELLMLMPLLPMFLVMAWVSRSADRKPSASADKRQTPGQKPTKSQQTSAATAWFTLKSEWMFVYLILVPCLVYLVLFKPEIGMARDWDLFAMTNLALIPLALLILNRFYRTVKPWNDNKLALFAGPALVITIVLGVAWIGINASSARTTNRFERILEYDRTHASYAYENLSIFYYDNKNLPKAIEMIEIATDISRNPRQIVRLGMYYDEAGRVEEATELMRAVLRGKPEFDKARFLLVALLEKSKAAEELLEVAREGTKYHPEEAIYWFYLGEMSIGLGNIEEGVAAFKKCLTLNPPDAAAARAREQIKKFSPPQQ